MILLHFLQTQKELKYATGFLNLFYSKETFIATQNLFKILVITLFHNSSRCIWILDKLNLVCWLTLRPVSNSFPIVIQSALKKIFLASKVTKK